MAEGDGPAVLSPRPVVGTSPEPVTSLPDDLKPASAAAPKGASRVADAKSSTAAVLDQNGAAGASPAVDVGVDSFFFFP